MLETNFEFSVSEHESFYDLPESFGTKRKKHDPLVKEFFAFCKINNLEKEAAILLDKKIKEIKSNNV